MIYGSLKSIFYCIPVDAYYPSNKVVTPQKSINISDNIWTIKKSNDCKTFLNSLFLKFIFLLPKVLLYVYRNLLLIKLRLVNN